MESLASVQILDSVPRVSTQNEFEELLARIARTLAAGGVVSRKLMASMDVGWWGHGMDTNGGDQRHRFRNLRTSFRVVLDLHVTCDHVVPCPQERIAGCILRSKVYEHAGNFYPFDAALGPSSVVGLHCNAVIFIC